jgi:hypothetical protein
MNSLLNNDKLIDDIYEVVSSLRPDFLSINYPHESRIPIASVCLVDAWLCLKQTQFALHNYNEVKSPFKKEYFLEDIAVRLYSTAEHIANALQFIFEIDDKDLNAYQEKRTSKQIAIGRYLINNMNDHPIAHVLKNNFNNNIDWNKTIDYRSAVVHDQPPIIEGGIKKFNRKPKWKNSDGSIHLGISFDVVCDEHDYTMNELESFLMVSYTNMINTCNAVIKYYLTILKQSGFEMSDNKND